MTASRTVDTAKINDFEALVERDRGKASKNLSNNKMQFACPPTLLQLGSLFFRL